MAHFLAREGNLCVCERYLHVPAAHLHVDERRKHVCDGKVKGKGKPLRRAARAACREPKHGSGSTSKPPRCSQRNGPLSFAPLSPPVFGWFPDLAILGNEFPSNPVISERAVGMQMDTEITRNLRK